MIQKLEKEENVDDCLSDNNSALQALEAAQKRSAEISNANIIRMQQDYAGSIRLPGSALGALSRHVSAYIPGGIPDAMEWQTISVTIVVTSYCRTDFATVGRTPLPAKRPTVQSTEY